MNSFVSLVDTPLPCYLLFKVPLHMNIFQQYLYGWILSYSRTIIFFLSAGDIQSHTEVAQQIIKNNRVLYA